MKDSSITVRVSKREKVRFSREATKQEKTVSEWMRDLGRRELEKPKRRPSGRAN